MMNRTQRQAFIGKVKRLMEEGCDIPEIIKRTGKPKVDVERAVQTIEISKKRQEIIERKQKS